MSKIRKLMMASLLLIVVVMISASSTISWLSSQSETVVNTFAGGAISIILDEALVSTDGKKVTGENAKRVTANTYKYKAGATLDKDPTPTVLKGSEECYVFLCVDNELSDKFSINYDTQSWLQAAKKDSQTVYIYKTKINALEADSNVQLNPIFTKISVSTTLTSQDIADLGERKLSITAYAVQTESLTSKEAIDLAVAQFLSSGAQVNYPDVN